MALIQNSDGLVVNYGREGNNDRAQAGTVEDAGQRKHLVIKLDPVNGLGFPVDTNNDGTGDAFSSAFPFIPAGAYIDKATVVVQTAFAGGTNFTIGLAKQDGTVIDADGIDATVLTAALAANKAVRCDGALVGGTDGVGANNAYVYTSATGTYTAGAATLLIEYILPY